MKKVLSLVVVAAMVLGLAACAAPAAAPAAAAPAAEAAAPAAKEEAAPAAKEEAAPAAKEEAAPAAADAGSDRPLIGLSHFNFGANNYCSTYAKHAQEVYDEQYKDKFDFVILDAQNDADKQLSDIDDLISMGCDCIIVWPVSGTAVVPGLKAIKDAGIPCVNTNSKVDSSATELLTCFTGPSDFDQGVQAGEAMIAGLKAQGKESGKIVELSGQAGYDTAIQRTKGFAKAIEGTGYEVIEEQPADWSTEKAQTIMETYIAKYGDTIDGAYCADDGVSAGVLNALEAAGMNDGHIIITSPTLFASGYDAIADGKQWGSILQSPLEDAELALEVAYGLTQGQTYEYDNKIPTWIVDQSNYKEFDRPVW